MSTAGNTPNFVAETAIYPFRCVKIGSANFSAVPSTGDPEILLGVTDGSVRDFNSQYHATAGQPVSLQNGEFVQLTASGTISVGDLLIATTDGKVMADTVATEYVAQAADNATDGEVFWAKRIGAWTVGGGGGGGTMTIDVQEFDNPEAENTWVKPAGAVWVTVRMCGAGQDGSAAEGFSYWYGGNGGTVAEKHFNATSLPASVGVVLGVHQPWGTASDAGTSAFGTYLYAGMAAAFGIDASVSGGSTIEYCGAQTSLGFMKFGQGENNDMSMDAGGNHGFAFGPGGGGGCSPFTSGVGGKASTNGAVCFGTYTGMAVASGGGGAAGSSDGIGPGGNGGNGPIDAATGFGSGGGAGGQGGSGEDGGDGGNAYRGGGGGAGGLAGAGGINGLPGAGGDGYVRVTTICYN